MKLLSSIVYFLTIKPRLIKLKKLLPDASIHPAGSRYVCNPPVLGTDIDFLVYSKEKFIDVKLVNAGYKESPFADYRGVAIAGDFTAWRKGRINLIVTSSVRYATTFHTATHISKQHNIRDKWHRILLHEGLRAKKREDVPSVADLPPELLAIVDNFHGPYGNALHKAYRIQHELGDFP